MSNAIMARNGEAFAHDPAYRGYHAVYRPNETNHCPGCGRSHWYVGRLMAECGFCGTALALAETQTHGIGALRQVGRPDWRVLAAA
jgi:hypothetical protein